MKEKKECPYCGEEILITAKKCKHCGEWLDDNKRLQFNAPNTEKIVHVIHDTTERQNSIKKAYQEAKQNEEFKNALPVQFLIISIVLGFIYKSWWVGIGTFFGLSFLIALPYVGNIVCVLLSFLYASIGYGIGTELFGNNMGWVIAFIIGFISLGINTSSKDWFVK